MDPVRTEIFSTTQTPKAKKPSSDLTPAAPCQVGSLVDETAQMSSAVVQSKFLTVFPAVLARASWPVHSKNKSEHPHVLQSDYRQPSRLLPVTIEKQCMLQSQKENIEPPQRWVVIERYHIRPYYNIRSALA
jgi:hypothetical protein